MPDSVWQSSAGTAGQCFVRSLMHFTTMITIWAVTQMITQNNWWILHKQCLTDGIHERISHWSNLSSGVNPTALEKERLRGPSTKIHKDWSQQIRRKLLRYGDKTYVEKNQPHKTDARLRQMAKKKPLKTRKQWGVEKLHWNLKSCNHQKPFSTYSWM